MALNEQAQEQMRRIFFGCLAILLAGGVWAQETGIITGKVTDETGEGLIGASVIFEGTTRGTQTDLDGNYSLDNLIPGTYNLRYSFVGFKTSLKPVTVTAGQTLAMDVQLGTDAQMLQEAVVVGYGTAKKEDLTGSTVVVSTEDFQSGNVTTPEQLVTGKVSGVQITSNDGAPGSGSRIRIRGGTSINASNDPLIVIDGVPLDNGNISGAANPLSLINPQDIESFVVLKDASAAAIYGSRGANGVILITTKKGVPGMNKLNVDFQSKVSISEVVKTVDVLSAQELRDAIEQNNPDFLDELGNSNTDWQDEIYQNGFITENNLSLSGGIKELPYRLSIGYKREEGVLRRSQLDRTSLGLNLSPSLLKDRLKVDINAKYTNVQNFFADRGSIGSAVGFDPTQSVNSDTVYTINDTPVDYQGYYEWVNNSGRVNPLAPRNPVGLLMSREDESDVNRFIGNVKLDYQLPFVDGVTATVNAGMDQTSASGFTFRPAEAGAGFTGVTDGVIQGGEDNRYEQDKINQVLDLYVNYRKDLENLDSDINATLGYSWQRWETESPTFPNLSATGDTITPEDPFPFFTDNALVSFYGRLVYDFKDKYLLTATLRRDGSSRFSPDTRWGMFPSFAFAWRVSEEGFMKDAKRLSYLKARGGWGVTGQQDIGNDYPWIANYDQSTLTAQYHFGNQFFGLLRPDGYDLDIKWEETTSINVGVDFGFFNDRLFGTVDLYQKDTDDLLAIVDVVSGTNFTNEILTNVGSMTNKGIEVELSVVAIDKKDLDLTVGANLTSNRNEITRLTKVADPENTGILVGGIAGGVGNNVQIHAVGSPVFSFFVFEQVYDQDGNPIEGEYVDRNGDGQVNQDDRYIAEKPEPDMFLGFYSDLRYKKWNFGFNLRAELDRYVYNNVASSRGTFQSIDGQFITNLSTSFLETGFIGSTDQQLLSDHYIERADFLRMDYFNIGYDVGRILKDRANLGLGVTVNNVFVVSGYSGIDPEVVGGIDNDLFPRPRIYSFNLNLNF